MSLAPQNEAFEIVDGLRRGNDSPIFPLEAGRPRVQRLISELAPVHLESEMPVREQWALQVDGEVNRPLSLSLDDLRELGEKAITADFHCVWGWSVRDVEWRGVSFSAVCELAEPTGEARYVSLQAADSPYDSCVPIESARAGFLAWKLGEDPLPHEHGGPLRWLQPDYLWGYKGVKWLGAATFRTELVPGFWESKVGDVAGEVPSGVLGLFERKEEA